MKPDICIYHSPCADGFGAAWAVWKRWGDDVQYVPGVYGHEPPDTSGKHVLIVDFSYKRAVLEEMGCSALTVTILDHHKTAQSDLSTFAQSESGNIHAEFDMNRSGAVMTWEWCHPDKPVPQLLKHVEDRDLWRFALPGTREIQAVVFSHPYDFRIWDWLVARAENSMALQEMINEGAGIERKHIKDVHELLAQTRREMTIGGVRVPVANLPYTMASDAAGAMAKGCPFAACYFDRPDARVFSLRSCDGGMDVSEVAKAYGGGGHRNAAGFQAPLGWEGDGASS